MAAFDRLPLQEFETLTNVGNQWPQGITADPDIIYVSDQEDSKIYAYDRATKLQIPRRDFDTLINAGNTMPSGITHNNVTMFVADAALGHIFAYDFDSKLRDVSKDIPINPINADEQVIGGIYLVGQSMYVVFPLLRTVRVYDTITRNRVEAFEFGPEDLPHVQTDIWGIWGNGTIIWISDLTTKNLYAYERVTKVRREALDFTVVQGRIRDGDIGGVWRYHLPQRGHAPTDVSTNYETVYQRQVAHDHSLFTTAADFQIAGLAANDTLLYALDRRAFLTAVYAYRQGSILIYRDSNGVLRSLGIGRRTTEDITHSAMVAAADGAAITARDVTNDGTLVHILLNNGTSAGVVSFRDGAHVTPGLWLVGEQTQAGDNVFTDLAASFPNNNFSGICIDGDGVAFFADNTTKAVHAWESNAEDTTKRLDGSIVRSANATIDIQAIEHDGESLLILDGDSKAVYGYRRSSGEWRRDPAKDITSEVMLSANPLMEPVGLCFMNDRLFVADANTGKAFAFRSIHSSTSIVSQFNLTQTLLQSAESDIEPSAVAVDGEGDALVLDKENHTIRAFSFTKSRRAHRASGRDISTEALRGTDQSTAVNVGAVASESSRYYVVDTTREQILAMTYSAGAYTRTTARDLSKAVLQSALVPYGVTPSDDLIIGGLAWDGSSLWVLFSNHAACAAFDYSTTTNTWTPNTGKRFRTTGITYPRAITWTGTRLLVADNAAPQVLAYTNAGLRDTTKDIIFEALGLIDPAFTVGGLATVVVSGGTNRILVLNSNANNAAVYAFLEDTGARDVAYDVQHNRLLSASTDIWLNGIAFDGTRLLVSDQRSDAVWAFTYEDSVDAARVPAKDVPASVLESANANINPVGLVWDGEHYLVGHDQANDGNVNRSAVYAFTSTGRYTQKDIAPAVLSANTPQVRIGGMALDSTGRLYVLDNHTKKVWSFLNQARTFQYDINSGVLRAATTSLDGKGIAFIGETCYVLDGTQDTVYAFDQTLSSSGAGFAYAPRKDIAQRSMRRANPALSPTGIAGLIDTVNAPVDGVLLVTDESGIVYGFTPPSTLGTGFVEVSDPRGIHSVDIPGEDESVMLVVGSGTQDKIFAFEMPDTPLAPRWNYNRQPAIQFVVEREITPLKIPAAQGNPAPTYAVTGLPRSSGLSPLTFNANTLTLSGAAATGGPSTGTIRITATNAYGSAVYLIPWRVGVTSQPVFDTSQYSYVWTVGSDVNALLPAASGYPAPTYGLQAHIPGLSFDPVTRRLTGVPTNVVGNRVNVITARNSRGTATKQFTYRVEQLPSQRVKPTWFVKTQAPVDWAVGRDIGIVQIPPVDVGTPTPSYTMFPFIPGVVFDPTLRQLTGAPERLNPGGTITITAKNVEGLDRFTFGFRVAAHDLVSAPLWNQPTADITVNVGSNVNYLIPRINQGAPFGPDIYSVDEQTLPAGLVYNTDTVSISGIPTQKETISTIITANNGIGSPATFTINWTVQIGAPNWGIERLPALVLVEGRAIDPYQLPEA